VLESQLESRGWLLGTIVLTLNDYGAGEADSAAGSQLGLSVMQVFEDVHNSLGYSPG